MDMRASKFSQPLDTLQSIVEDVLARISTTPASRIADLTPWGWAAARAAELQPPAS